MKLQEGLHKEEIITKKNPVKEDRIRVQDQLSNQQNTQDLDQEQNVEVKPLQLNTQNLHITTECNSSNYAGKITGVTYLEENRKIIPNVNILLYFGDINNIPIYKTKSDENGNFVIEDLPPGYYSLVAYLGKDLKYVIQYIKVLISQNVYQSILLSDKYAKWINDENKYSTNEQGNQSDKVVEYIFLNE